MSWEKEKKKTTQPHSWRIFWTCMALSLTFYYMEIKIISREMHLSRLLDSRRKPETEKMESISDKCDNHPQDREKTSLLTNALTYCPYSCRNLL